MNELVKLYDYGTAATEELIRQFETAKTDRKKQKIVNKLNKWAGILGDIRKVLETKNTNEQST